MGDGVFGNCPGGGPRLEYSKYFQKKSTEMFVYAVRNTFSLRQGNAKQPLTVRGRTLLP
jgi:hypothetical protein